MSRGAATQGHPHTREPLPGEMLVQRELRAAGIGLAMAGADVQLQVARPGLQGIPTTAEINASMVEVF